MVCANQHLNISKAMNARIKPFCRPSGLWSRISQAGVGSLLVCCLLITFGTVSAAEPADTNYDETLVPHYDLPDPLIGDHGQALDLNDWKSFRRNQVLNLFEQSVYGKTPDLQLPVEYEIVEKSASALGGKATRIQVAAHFGKGDRTHRLDMLIYIPNGQPGSSPGFIGLNFNGNHTVHQDPGILINRKSGYERGSYSSRWQLELLMDNGYSLTTVHRDQIDPDNYQHNFSDGIHPLFYTDGQDRPGPDEWGAIGAWAWGLSRTLDYLETIDEVDAGRMAVIGHSRLGKTALWAGAQDDRFALVISNNSGCGGAALYRRCFGERIHHMIKPVGYWFCTNHREYQKKEENLPVDQHMLMALIAPRPLYIASATEDLWADPKGEFLAAHHAGQVYDLYGKSSLSTSTMPQPDHPIHTTTAYHIRSGKHDVTEFDWKNYIKFANQFLK